MNAAHPAEIEGGVLTVDKPAGMTSHDVVARVRRLYGTKQVGHTGTLDPNATGVLPVMVGRAVKASEYLTSEKKTYEALLRLGVTSDTEDVWGVLRETGAPLPSPEQVTAAARRFTGEILQIPPMYSALKRGGRKLCDLARAGIEVERAARPVTVHALDVSPVDAGKGLYALTVTCSKGTYIRTLCADIGKELGCGGVMAALRRTACGAFTVDDAHTPEELERMTEAERFSVLRPTEELFSDLPELSLPPFQRKLCASGCAISLKKLGADFPEGALLRLYGGGKFFALGKVGLCENGPAVKAVKQFYFFEKDD
ncbi:MAG: tRNA pseudouridine(55) synthase TruB [Clostridia bacterium]|nr:tRNA pseudouridine(55) synthase TruB [Clostridia bacterium]